MTFWWHLSKIEASTPYFEIIFWLVQNLRSIHNAELFVTCVALSLIYVYPANDVREAISPPAGFIMSLFHQFVQQVLKSPATIEQRGNSSFIWLRRILKFVQKILNSSWLWLSKQKAQVKKQFLLCDRISGAK